MYLKDTDDTIDHRGNDVFRFDPDVETAMLRRLDELRELMGLPSRGHVVEFAIRSLWASKRQPAQIK